MDGADSGRNAEVDPFDPVTLEIFWSRLISIADEAATGLLRTAFSTIVRESNDFATVLMDRDGNSVSENTGGIASFSCILPRTTKAFLERFPAGDLAAGRLRHHQRSLARDRPPARFHGSSARSSIAARWSALPAPSRIRPTSAARCGRPIAASCSRKGSASRRSGSCARARATSELIDILLAQRARAAPGAR